MEATPGGSRQTTLAPRVAVVGAGIAGLTSAYRLDQAGWQVEVFEAADRPGGRVETVSRDGYLIDTGATAIAARYPVFTTLAEELGLAIVPTSPHLGVVRDGRVHLLRLDRLARSGLGTRLLARTTKLRLGRIVIDILVAKARGLLDYDDLRKAARLDSETAQDYVRRMAGPEADAFFGEPITRALLLANSDQVSKVELMSGLINAVAGRLATLAGGQAAIIDALVGRIGGVRLGTEVREVVRTGSGVLVRADGPNATDVDDEFDACVVACPLPVAASISGEQNGALTLLDRMLRFTKGINVAIGTTRVPDTPAFLVQLPRDEDSEIAMVIFEHNKAADRAPAGHGLFTLSWEMTAAARWIDRPDDELIERATRTLIRLFPELDGTIELGYVRRWPTALPHTRAGVYRAIGEFTAALDPASPIQYAGDYLSQTGQNTAAAWGERAAANLIHAVGRNG